MIDWASFLQHYGYYAVLIGTFLEGETILLLSAYAVQHDIFNFWLLITVATIGSFIGDQFYYQIGAKFGHSFIHNRPKLAQKFHQASQWIDRYPTLSILFMRFAWGLRTVIPISFGIKKYPLPHYIMVNIAASFLWAFVVVSIGLQVAHWLHQFWQFFMIEDGQRWQVVIAVILCLCLLGAVYAIICYRRNQK